MKKIASAVIGLSLTLATAGLSFAAQAAPAQATPVPADNNTAPAAKKHVKKNTKKAVKNTATTPSSTPAPAASK